MRPFLLLVLFAVAGLAATPPRMETRWPGLHLVWYDEFQLKSVVVEFSTFLAVVEVPRDDATARGLLAMLRDKFPGKPLRFAFHTHHHDHSIGALDPLFASGVTLVTTRWNLDQIRKLAANPAGADAHVLAISGGFEIADGGNSIRAHVLSKANYKVPTDEYILVELPAAKALVSGCLFNKPLTYWEVVNTRKTSLQAFLLDRKLDVAWLVPTNTSKAGGFEDVCGRGMLTETLEKGMRPDQVADRLQARTAEDLRRDLDALAAEFGAKTPRSYDLLVCGNFLKSERKDFARAAILFEIAARLFPKEADPYRLLGDSWSLAGEKAKAREAWSRALERTTKEEEHAELRERLAKP